LIKCFTYRNNKILYLSFVALYSLLKVYSLNTTAMSEYYNITIENKPYNERLIHFRQHFNDVK
ncbi:MAG: EpsG family protein, partial [Prevotella pectinovora]